MIPYSVSIQLLRPQAVELGRCAQREPDMAGNKAPVLNVDGVKARSVKAGEPVTVIAVTDDGKSNPRPMHFALELVVR